MKLINILLIGFLSTVSFLSLFACSDDTIAPSSTTPLRIVADIDNQTPELYENTVITLKAVDSESKPIKAAWNATDTDGIDLSFDPTTVINSETITIKITDKATAKGVIIAKVNIDGTIFETDLKIIPSTIALKSVAVSPVDAVIKIVKGTGSLKLSTLATFENNRSVDVTKDTVWSMTNTADIKLNVDTGTVTATAVVSSPSIVTGTFTSGSVKKSDESAITSLEDIIGKITVSVKDDGTSKLPLGASKQLIATALYSSGVTGDVTDEVSWKTSDASIIQINQSVKGEIVGKKGLGSATITATFSNGKKDQVEITGSAPELTEIVITQADITDTKPNTPIIEATDSNNMTPQPKLEATDFTWTLTLVNGNDAKAVAIINEKTGIITAKENVSSTDIKITATLNNTKQPTNLSSIRVAPITVNIKTTP